MKGTSASLAAPAARKAAAMIPCNVQAPIRREGRDDWIETALMLVSVGCEVESERKLRRRPSSQQPIYLDIIHRFSRYTTDRARPEVMDVFRTAVIERSAGGAMSQSAHAFSDVIRQGGHDGLSVWVAAARAMSPPRRSVWELVKEEIDGGNFAVPDDYEIGSGVSWRLARAAR